MSNATQTFRLSASINPPTSVKIYNVTTPGTANTETSQALTSGTKQFTIKVRGEADLQLAFIATESGTNYITIPACSSYSVSNVDLIETLYFQVNKPSQIVEIIEYST